MKNKQEIRVPVYPKNSKCVECGVSVSSKPKGHEMKRISAGFDKMMMIWLNYKILIDKNHHYFCSTCFSNDDNKIPFKLTNEVNFDYLLSLLTESFKKIKKNTENQKKKKNELILHRKPFFSSDSFENENIIQLSGISKKNLNELSILLNQPIEKIFEFLIIFKQGLSQRFSSILFEKSRSLISNNIHEIINSFEKSFVNENIGSNTFSRDKIIKNHIPFFFFALFPEVKGIIDSTYFYIEKSEVFEFQKKSFCKYKHRNLLKEIGYCFTRW